MRRLLSGCLLLVFLVTCFMGLGLMAAIALVLANPWLFDDRVNEHLEGLGFDIADVSVQAIHLGEIKCSINRLSLQGHALNHGQLTLTYSYDGLRQQQLDRIRLEDALISVTVPKPKPKTDTDTDTTPKAEADFGWLRWLHPPVDHLEVMHCGIVIHHEGTRRFFRLRADATVAEASRLDATLVSKEDVVGIFALADARELAFDGGIKARTRTPDFWLTLLRDLSGNNPALAAWDMDAHGVQLHLAVERHGGPIRFRVGMGIDQPKISSESLVVELQTLDSVASGTYTLGDAQPLQASVNVFVDDGQLSQPNGSARVEGIHGEIRIAQLHPLRFDGMPALEIASAQSGQLHLSDGRLVLNRRDDGSFAIFIEGQSMGGGAELYTTLLPGDNGLSGDLKLNLTTIALEQVAALLPDFEGEIRGLANGTLQARLEGNRLIILPGHLEMAAETEGYFSYRQSGWLVGPGVDVDKLLREKDLIELANDPAFGNLVPEVALRDLTMKAFRMDVGDTGRADKPVIIHINGIGPFKGVPVDITVDVPVGPTADVLELINRIIAGKAAWDRLSFQ